MTTYMTSKKSDENVSRRKFLKRAGAVGAIGGAAAMLSGLSVSPMMTAGGSATSASSPTGFQAAIADNSFSPFYRPVERHYYLYATDGIINVPTDWAITAPSTHRPMYMYGFAKPIGDTRPIGSTTALSLDPTKPDFAFKDLFWTEKSPLLPGSTLPVTNEAGNALSGIPVMKGRAPNPGAPIWGVEGDVINVTLFNLGMRYAPFVTDAHTIHLHGAHSPTYYDGIPELSFGIPMAMFNDDGTLASDPKNSMFTYRMYCERPGTYLYHCHVEASEHVQMGMYGPMWVYPKEQGLLNKTGGWAYGSPMTSFSQEVMLLFTEIDDEFHDGLFNPWKQDYFGNPRDPGPNPVNSTLASIPNYYADTSDPFVPGYKSTAQFHPNYWLVNGRCFPDTVLPGKYTCGYQPGGATPGGLLQDQLSFYEPVGITSNNSKFPVPSATLITIPRQPVQTVVATGVGERVLVRTVHAGFQSPQPLHFHGVMPTIIAKDTEAWLPTTLPAFSANNDQTRRIFTLNIVSGEMYDLIVTYPNKALISPSVYGTILNNPAVSKYSAEKEDWGGPFPYVAPSPLPAGWIGPQAGLVNAAQQLSGLPQQKTGVAIASSDPTATAYGFFDSYPLFYLWHVHDDYKVTNNGSYPGGAAVFVRVDKEKPAPKPSIIFNNIPA
jgi:FtsP/CotA-like multicopper oxidase with cupredoxin domain